MSFGIEIYEGHNPSSYFWFIPVILKEKGVIFDSEVIELDDEFSIEEENVFSFLWYFLIKYFDQKLSYNMRRDNYGYNGGAFDPNLTYHFYTYETLEKMADDILEVAYMLENDYHNIMLEDIKKKFEIGLMCSNYDYEKAMEDSNAVQNNIKVVTGFYRRFVKRLRKMMANSPETNIISIMGPQIDVFNKLYLTNRRYIIYNVTKPNNSCGGVASTFYV